MTEPAVAQAAVGSPRSRLRARIAHVVLILAGLALIVWPLTLGAALELNCRGARLQPGQSCAKAGGEGVQTYEQRVASGRSSRPVIMAVGAAVAVFGASLLILDVRRLEGRRLGGRRRHRPVDDPDD